MPRRKPLKFAELHCGIGALRLAFEDVGAECVWSYTADAKARRCYRENFGDSVIGTADDIPAHDILAANLDECAATAKRRRSAQRPHEMILDVICLHRPLACLIAGKADGADATSRTALIQDLVRLGYFVHRDRLEATRFRLAQTGTTDFIAAFDRETGFRFPPGCDQKATIDELLDPQPHDRYYISEASRDKLIARRGRSMNNGNKWHMGFVADGYANKLSDSPDAPYDNILIEPDRWRVLTEREVARLQGVTDSLVLHPDWRTARKQLARCIPVPVAAAVAERIVAELRPNSRTRKKQASAKVVGEGFRRRMPSGAKPEAKSDAASRSTSPLRWYGSLNGYASQIVKLFPKHESYCEVFGGSAAILLSKPPSKIETFNDLDENLVQFWQVLREESLRKRLIEMTELAPFNRAEFRDSRAEQDDSGDPVTGVWKFLNASHESHNSGGADNSDWLRNKNNGMTRSVWGTLPARLAEVGQRLKRVQVEHLPFEDILRRYDTSADTFFLLDPPYLPETRASGNRYTHECSRDDHIRLLRITRSLDARVAICSYRSDLYDDLLEDWHRTDIKGKSYAGPRAKGCKLRARALSVYTNYEPPSR